MTTTDRREFIGTLAAGTVALTGAAYAQDDKRTLRMGIIGMGWYGMVDAKAALGAGGVDIVSICDIDSEHLASTAKELEELQGKRPATFKLYGEMLAESELDVVVVATPPHWHALQLIACVERGLDVYCEKPLTYDVREGRAVVDAVRKSGRLVQIGFQRRQSPSFRQVKEFIAGGGIGNVVQVDAQIHYRAGTKDTTAQEPPESLDWDLWCGPAPKLPYSPQVGHLNWRLETTTGHGHLVDWGIHNIDATRMVLDLGAPQRITAAGGLYQMAGRITTPDTLSVHFEFERCPVVWRHRIWGAAEYAPDSNNGIFFYGEKGTVFASDNRWVHIPGGRNAERQVHEAGADMGTLHMAEFLDAVREGSKSVACPIEQGYLSTSTVQLAMTAYESGAPVAWDAQSERITNNEAAAKLLKREYRKPWTHPWAG